MLEKWVDSNANKIGNQFKLLDDGDSANVIFMYRSIDDVLRGTVHYLKSNNYSGDVFCLRNNCPACARGVRAKNKLFIPLFNLDSNKFEIWYIDESFMSVLRTSVFKIYPNPSEVVFQVTRHGEHGNPKTQYSIVAIGKNGSHPYDKLIKDNGIDIESEIGKICKEFDRDAVVSMLDEYDAARSNKADANTGNTSSDNYGSLPSYQITPRGSNQESSDYDISVDDMPVF